MKYSLLTAEQRTKIDFFDAYQRMTDRERVEALIRMLAVGAYADPARENLVRGGTISFAVGKPRITGDDGMVAEFTFDTKGKLMDIYVGAHRGVILQQLLDAECLRSTAEGYHTQRKIK